MESQNTFEIIRKIGLRATPARKAVLNVVQSHSAPIDIPHILTHLGKQSIHADQATIYRIIDTFLDKGIIDRLQFQKSKFYYELSREEHHHAICTNCGAVEDISNCEISVVERHIEKTKGFKVKKHSLEFFGLCKNCI